MVVEVIKRPCAVTVLVDAQMDALTVVALLVIRDVLSSVWVPARGHVRELAYRHVAAIVQLLVAIDVGVVVNSK